MKVNIIIVHLISSLKRGGRERQLAGILKSSHTGYQNMAIVFNKSQNSYEQEYNLGSKLFYLHSKNPYSRLVEILKIIKREKPDIIWSWGGFEATFGLPVSLFSSARHVNGSIRHGIVRFNRKQIWRMILLHISRNIVANSFAGLKANRLKRGVVMYNGLDDGFFQTPDKTVFLEQNPDIVEIKKEGTLVLISVANLVPYKDYFTILKALQQINNSGIRFHYFIIGEGPDRSAIEKDITDKKLENNVHLLGRRNDIRELLFMGDIFIHSSLGEGCSNAIIEAMAAGLPVVATDTGGTSEIVKPSHGLLFEYGNSQQLTGHLQQLMENPESIVQMKINAREYAVTHFSMDRMMKDYESILENIMNK